MPDQPTPAHLAATRGGPEVFAAAEGMVVDL